ncbi:family 43 glycosylhydrolase [Aquibacillus halophilus]|uniref:Family 43 glycosylhydrolase n=1 Tax=Aquibacillus halophilus TaxID=930132 RepID=A0A6A8DIN3_9BACI|nr:family 43 glycosylhydrolase [Aquibacillus halophilus]MRH45110.1 family 43 glycosylhydrolase [Aquibacillus halophilus]
MRYVCNPINMEYKYQFISFNGQMAICREAADPSMIMFKGKYYLFPSMTAGFLTSDNLIDWEFYPLNDVPIYDYAPDVRVIGEYVYFSASKKEINCSFFRSKDPINEGFEEIEGTFPFWDPNLFVDDDGRIYFYWGCSNETPLYGVELNAEDLKPKGKPKELIFENEKSHGFERAGENHVPSTSPDEAEEIIKNYKKNNPDVSDQMLHAMKKHFQFLPFIEGVWMDKHNGKYYLQYSAPGTQYNVYADGVYISDNPLGHFTLAKNNPYSYKPGGFIPGAGHGSSMEDKFGNLWHTATMRISVNHPFERRLGIWPAGFDHDGELFCNQRYGDWPLKIEQSQTNPWDNPEWMLLSYGKPTKASSSEEGKNPSKITDEDVQTWWRAETNTADQWVEVDLKHMCDVHAIQINFADDKLDIPPPEGETLHGVGSQSRYIDQRKHYTRWILEGSEDGKEYFIIEDKSKAETDLSHDLVIEENGFKARYIRCTVKETPFNQNACISGLRVFGIGKGDLPKQATGVTTELVSELDLSVKWNAVEVVGYNVLWGFSPDKLYHSYMVFGRNNINIGALVKGEPVFVRVDTFNEVGITEGEIINVL